MLPFLLENEALIDRQLASVKGRVFSNIQEQFQRALRAAFGWQATAAAADAQQGPRGIDSLGGQNVSSPGRPGMGTPVPSGTVRQAQPPLSTPATATPGGTAAQAIQDLWKSYGPTVMATGASLLRPGVPQPVMRGDGQGASGEGLSPRPSMPSPRSSEGLTPPPSRGMQENGPAFPMPQYSPSLYPPAQIPLPRSTSNLPEHPAPIYSHGYSEVKGE